MVVNFPAERLQDKPLVFRRFLGDDHVAEVDGLRAGWILHSSNSGSPVWWWTLTGPCCGHARIENSGECATLDAAKQAFQRAYATWLTWASAEAGTVAWFGTAYAIPESHFLQSPA